MSHSKSTNITSSNSRSEYKNQKYSQAKVLAQGAEAVIIQEGDSIIKDRISKKYRHPELDKKIIKTRTKKEAKLLEKVSKLIPCPLPTNLKEIDHEKLPNKIIMPFIAGKKLSENLEQLDWKTICKIIGNQIAKIHDNNIIHSDLTTSNMIWVESETKDSINNPSKEHKPTSSQDLIKNKSKEYKPNSFQNSDTIINNSKISRSERARGTHEEANSNKTDFPYPRLYFIDFGLGFTSNRIEDRAVDLHLIKQALEAKHFSIYKEAEKIILDNYNSKDRTKVLSQLKKVEARGRYKHQ